MGTDRKTPLSEAGAAAPGRSQTTQQRSKVARTRLIVGGLVALAIVGGAVFLATRGGDHGVIEDLLGDTAPVPEVTLEVDVATYDATVAGVDAKTQEATVDAVSGPVVDTLEEMLRTAYVDPDTWDDPGDVEDFFTGDAADQVEADVAVLTLGEDAGDVYESLDPDDGIVTVRVLTGSEGKPLRTYARVAFTGLAARDDGTFTQLRVVGSYFLIADGDEWRIDSYRVDRTDTPAEAPATPAASGASATDAEASG